MSDLSKRIGALSPEKRLLLERAEQRLADKTGARAALSKVNGSAASSSTKRFSLIADEDRRKLPGDLEDAYPLTMLQMGMLYHLEIAPDSGSPVYHNVNSFHLRAPLDVEAFRRAVQRVIARHPVLRSSFDLARYSEPLQLVHAAAEPDVKVSDLRHLSPEAQEQELALFFESEQRRLFDLAHPPLIRFCIHRRSEETFQLTLTELHAISDGWSQHLMLNEIFTHYLASLEAEPPVAEPPLSISYRDFVSLERAALNSKECQVYWTQKLSDCTITQLPQWPSKFLDASIRKVQKPFYYFPPEEVEALKGLARAAGVPLKSVLLAAHIKVLSIVSSQDDVVTGLVSNGRPEEPGGERLLGLFLNTVPFRLRLDRGTWTELVQRTFESEVELLPFRRYPMAELQKKWGKQALFETAFTYLHFHSVEPLLKSGKIGFSEHGSHNLSVANFMLSVVFYMSPVSDSVLSIILQYDVTRLSAEQVEAIYGYYERVLRAMADDPSARHDSQCFLSRREQQQILVKWNGAEGARPGNTCIHEAIEAQAERSPDAAAVVLDGKSLSYGELNRLSNQLAHFLISRGVRPESLVGISMDRSLEMIVGLLGILKAGGAYVPIDPAYPKERRAFILEDIQAGVLLTQSRLAESLPATSAQLVCLDDWQIIADQNAEDPVTGVSADNLAYLIYTSGSTGRPKAVMISHRNLLQSTIARAGYYREPMTGFLLLPSFAFDSSVAVIFGTLYQGGTLFLSPEGLQRDPAHIAETIERNRVSHLLALPSVYSQLLAMTDPRQLEPLRAVIVAGEACPKDLIRTHEAIAPQSGLFNEYGPTEGTVWSSVYDCMSGELDSQVPIGRPIDGAQIYVLDWNLQPAPITAPGELHIGGSGIARGYLKRPELTAEKFIPNPFAAEPGSRLYKTGDLARHLPDGNIEFLGRADGQVKIRGYRIELQEIDTVLNQHPAVRDAVVVVREDTPGNKRLVAYIVPEAGMGVTMAQLRAFFSDKLPDFMMPSACVTIDTLPLTPNGKLDRQALPAPDHEAPELKAVFSSPRTPVEELIAETWAEVLGVQRIGIHDNFFDYGGHSLLATQVVSRLRRVFQTAIPLQLLFDKPTIAALAREINIALDGAGGDETPPIEPVSSGEGLCLSFAQRRLWFLDQLEPGNPLYNVPAAIRLEGKLDVGALERSLSEIVRRHSVLRTTFAEVDGEPIQRIGPAEPVILPLMNLSGLPYSERDAAVMRLAKEESQRPFNLSQGPLLRASLLRLDDDDHVVLLTMHHIVSDAWSVGIFILEITQLFSAFSVGKPSPLPEMVIQYADFANWQHRWLRGEVFEKQLAYWKRQLAGAPVALDLRTDKKRPDVSTFQGSCRFFELPQGLSVCLSDLARYERATSFMILFAAFNTLLHRHSRQRDIVVGVPIAGRGRTEVEGLIGFFVNTLALRTDLSSNPTFLELLGRVRKAALDAYAHQDLPFEKIVEELQPDRKPGRTPLFQVVFTMQNAPMPALELPGLELTPLTIDRGTAKYELVLNMRNTEKGFAGSLEYNTDLFNESTITRFLEDFERLLASIVENPSTRIGDLRMLSQEDTARAAKAAIIDDLESSFSF